MWRQRTARPSKRRAGVAVLGSVCSGVVGHAEEGGQGFGLGRGWACSTAVALAGSPQPRASPATLTALFVCLVSAKSCRMGDLLALTGVGSVFGVGRVVNLVVLRPSGPDACRWSVCTCFRVRPFRSCPPQTYFFSSIGIATRTPDGTRNHTTQQPATHHLVWCLHARRWGKRLQIPRTR